MTPDKILGRRMTPPELHAWLRLVSAEIAKIPARKRTDKSVRAATARALEAFRKQVTQ